MSRMSLSLSDRAGLPPLTPSKRCQTADAVGRAREVSTGRGVRPTIPTVCWPRYRVRLLRRPGTPQFVPAVARHGARSCRRALTALSCAVVVTAALAPSASAVDTTVTISGAGTVALDPHGLAMSPLTFPCTGPLSTPTGILSAQCATALAVADPANMFWSFSLTATAPTGWRFDGWTGAPCAGSGAVCENGTAFCLAPPPPPLPPGPVSCVGGTPSTTLRASFVDVVAPVAAITARPPAIDAGGTARFTFEAAPAAENLESPSFACSRDGLPYQPCTSPVAYTGVQDGPHDVCVKARDPSHDFPPGTPTGPQSCAHWTEQTGQSTAGGAGTTNVGALRPSPARPGSTRRVRVRVRDYWVWSAVPDETRMVRLLLTSIPKAAHITVTCHGQHCRERRLSRHGVSRLDVARSLGAAHLRPGDRVDLRVVRHGWVGMRLVYTVRSHKLPSATLGCLSAAKARPMRCPR